MNTCYYLVGLPGSGKSTYAKELSKETGALIFSSDAIREEIGADGGDTSKHSEVFQILHRRLKGGLLRGNDVIYDATNISYKNRVSFLNELGKLNIEINKVSEEQVDCNTNNCIKVVSSYFKNYEIRIPIIATKNSHIFHLIKIDNEKEYEHICSVVESLA